jgi:H+/Cl- antiporter ClcA
MNLKEKLQPPAQYLLMFGKWSLLALLMGALGGTIGGVFHHTLHFVTHLRQENGWLLWLLPLGGLLTVGIYHVCKLRGNRGTNEIIDAVLDEGSMNPLIAPVIFLSTAITHLFGGSAGREGAALQLGSATASALSKVFRLNSSDRTVLIMSGMSAVFAGLFGTPLTACLFTMEFASVGVIFSPALLPCYLSAFVASQASLALGVHPEVYLLETALPITMTATLKVAGLSILIALLGISMCYIFHHAEHMGKKWIPNDYLRIAVGGALIALLTFLVGDQRFNGAGMDLALEAVAGHADWYSFAVKLLFTAITLSAGFNGGESVPTFCIGATFGCFVGPLLGLDPGISAAIGLVGLFCCATNSPLTAILLSMEMFGSTNLYMFAWVCVITFMLSGHSSLYTSQIIRYHKTSTVGNHGRD